MLRNYKMKDEINCFVVFKIDKYRINYIVTARNSAYRGTPFVPNETFNLIIIVRDEMYCLALVNASHSG